jgi:hypothetical protein
VLLASASALVTAISSAVVAGVLAIGLVANWQDYRSRSRAQAAEANAKLAETFAGLVTTANGRSGSHISETAAAYLLEGFDHSETDDVFRKRLEHAVSPGPVGVATQAAAIASIAELIAQHRDFLLTPGTTALENLRAVVGAHAELKPVLEAALARVKNAD